MARIVMKFGGTSVADLDRIRRAAARVKAETDAGNEVAVVVSAMAGVTNAMVKLVSEAASLADLREYDTVVSSGEQVTSGLMAVVLQSIGVPARSWMGWQVPIRTDEAHGSARIEGIEVQEIVRRFGEGQVAVVAGFQGIDPAGRITTLGRGGSDTSAVALAAALQADRCDIYTDVDGVYTSDPRIVAKARKLDRITYEEMLEMASQGTKVLQTRSVEMAMKHRVRIQVLSSFEASPGTLVVDEDEIVEQALVSGIAYSRDEAKITLLRVPDQPGVAAKIFGPLAEAAINVDMIVQNISAETGRTDLTFTVNKTELDRAVAVLRSRQAELNFEELRSDPNVVKVSVIGVGMRSHAGYLNFRVAALPELDRAVAVLRSRQAELNFEELRSDPNVVKVSVIGVGMRSHAGVAQQMFTALAERGINIQVISTSEIKVSVLIAEEYTELALRGLHTAYGLDAA